MSAWAVTGLLLLAPTPPASADVSLVQVVQAQSGSDERGVLAKSLVEVSGTRMRVVTAVARKTGAGKAEDDSHPWRIVQVLDLGTTSLWVIDPDARTYERRPLTAVLEGPPSYARRRSLEIVASSVTVTPGTMIRRCLGADCSHFHVTASMVLKGRAPGRLKARLEQDIWMAPLTGGAQRGLLDLIAFEAAFRRQAGTDLSPLDRQTYRVAEAASYLGVPQRQLGEVVAQVRRALSDVPGYPLSSSVAWWSQASAPDPRAPAPGSGAPAKPPVASKTEPILLQDPPPPAPWPPRRMLARADWRGPWNRLDRSLARAQSGFGRAARYPAGLRPPVLNAYEQFRAEMAAVVAALEKAREAGPALRVQRDIPRERGAHAPAAPGPVKERKAGPESRLYEDFSEIGELVFMDGIPDDHFAPPPGFKKEIVKGLDRARPVAWASLGLW